MEVELGIEELFSHLVVLVIWKSKVQPSGIMFKSHDASGLIRLNRRYLGSQIFRYVTVTLMDFVY